MSEVKVYGVGVFGEGNKARVNGIITREYTLWTNMLARCYSKRYQEKQPTYVGCKVSSEFHDFTYFKNWCEKQIGFGNKGWALDKDILVKGNKVYSENVCVFVPREINSLLVNRRKLLSDLPVGVQPTLNGKYLSVAGFGATNTRNLGTFTNIEDAFLKYKEHKEVYIKKVATFWREHIDDRVYNALMSWEIDMND